MEVGQDRYLMSGFRFISVSKQRGPILGVDYYYLLELGIGVFQVFRVFLRREL